MYCKKHETSVATLQCSVCGEHFCELCNNGSDPFVCISCSEKSESIDSLTIENEFNVVDNEVSEVVEEELIDSNFNNFNGTLADDILNDILGSIIIPEKSKINFDPSDILSQIQAGIEAESAYLEEEADNNTKTTLDEDVSSALPEPSLHKIVLTKDILDEDSVNDVDSADTKNNDCDLAHEIELEITEEIDKVSTVDLLLSKVNSTKDITMDKINTTKDFTKERINNIDMTSTKEKASKLSEEAKIKSAAAAAFTVETAKKAKLKANEKIASNKSNLDETLTKIQQANTNGEYDDLLNKFNTRYGQGAKENDDGTHFALPLKINNFLYFLCSLVPGVAQFYLGLTKRGTTLLVIASVFLFITLTPSLYLITSILSFADAYKLRNIYYRGGVIEDSNKDIISFMQNKYVIIIIIATVIINIFRAIFGF